MELNFFVGGEDEIFQNEAAWLVLNEDGLAFLQYLHCDICDSLLERNKIKTDIRTSQLFFDNINGNESIFDFLLTQQNQRKN